MLVLVSVAGGLGAVARYVLDTMIKARTSAGYPFGTTVVNLSGSLVLGLVTGLTLGHLLPERWHLVVGAGFLGGYTTFSTASVETVRLLQERRPLAAASNAIAMAVLAVVLAALGVWLGLRLA